MNPLQNKELLKQVLQKAQTAAQQQNSPQHVMNILEGLSPDIAKQLSNNEMWQGMKSKSPQEIEAQATNLMHQSDIVTNVVSAISPEWGSKLQNSPILSSLIGKKSPAEMGGFVMKMAKMFGFIK